MPDDTQDTAGVVDPTKHNADLAQKLKDQDISGKSTVTGEFGEASDALDKLAAQKTPRKSDAVVAPKPDDKTVPKPDDKTAPKPDDKTAPKPDDKTAPKPDDKTAPKPDDKTAPKPDDTASLKRAEELFKDSPSLPPNASPKSAEAFASIKIKAANEISAREQKIAELTKKLEESKKPSAEHLQREKELEELRGWRAKLDVDFDPKFKGFDQDIEKQSEFIYAQLLKNPSVTPEIIEKIKKFGGPDMIDLGKLFEGLKDPTLQRLVEAKVADITMLKYNKDQAVKAAKENLGEYLKERKEAASRQTDEGRKATAASLDGLLKQLDWFSDRAVDGITDETEKKAAEEHNQFVATVKKHISETLTDDSPEMRAILIAGMAQLLHTQRLVPSLQEELKTTKAKLEDVQSKWEAMKNASRSRLQESAAPAGGVAPVKTDADVNRRAEDALDDIAKDILAKKQAAGR